MQDICAYLCLRVLRVNISDVRARLGLDCPRSGPGPVQALFADPGPGPQVQVQSFSDLLDLDTSTAVY